jgi:hypothetical protein
MASITLEQAKTVLSAAEERALELGEVDQDHAVAQAGVGALGATA